MQFEVVDYVSVGSLATSSVSVEFVVSSGKVALAHCAVAQLKCQFAWYAEQLLQSCVSQ